MPYPRADHNVNAVHGTTVFGRGPIPAQVMAVGEAPGETEAWKKKPFVGPAGQEQDTYLTNAGINPRSLYYTNVVKTYLTGNPDPTAALIAEWTPKLIEEVVQVHPAYIITAGRFATRWFLGDVDMDQVHGIPHRAALSCPAYDFLQNVVILPCYHPAYGLHDPDVRGLVFYDYRAAADIIRGRRPLEFAMDDLADYCEYLDVTPRQLQDTLTDLDPETPIGIDTEGIPGNEWSVQVATAPGTGLVLRKDQPDFGVGVSALRTYIDHHAHPVVAIHNGMYDIEMCAGMGLDLFEANLFDSMYAAFIMRTEPQGLKPLAYRWTGMRMKSYDDVVGNIGLEKQLTYLSAVMDTEWPDVEPRVEYENDGTWHLYTPKRIDKVAYAILNDFYSGKVTKDGPTDPMKRWRKADRVQRSMVEEVMGPMPIGTLADIPLNDAVRYSGRDPDATLRLYFKLDAELKRRGLSQLMADGMAVLPVFEEMQRNGFPARRSKFVKLSEQMWEEMCRLQARISHRYYNGKPFNPASPDKVAAIIRRRGLIPEKRSRKTNKISTAKKSIEHLRYEDEAMSDILTWREHQKIRDSFANPIIEAIDAEIGRRNRPDSDPVTEGQDSGDSGSGKESSVHGLQEDLPVLRDGLRSHKRGKGEIGGVPDPARKLAEGSGSGIGEMRAGVRQLSSGEGVAPEVESVEEDVIVNVRTNIKTTRTATRRLASGGIPLLAIPVRHKLGLMVRDGFEAPDGYDLGSWDLSQIEMRYMAHVSRDPLLHKFFTTKNPATGKDWDMHAETAARIFGMKSEDVDEMQHRYPAKRAGFGIITNIMGQGLLDQLRMFGCKGWDVEKCDDLITEWLKVYKGVNEFLDQCRKEVRVKGMVYDCWGMPRLLPGVWSKDKAVAAEAERAASSHKIQGGAQGMIQRSMAWLKPYVRGLRMAGEDVRWVLQIHDEVILMFPSPMWETLDPLVREGLTEHSLRLSVPVKCSGAKARTWGEL